MRCDYCGFLRGRVYKCLSCGAPPTQVAQSFVVNANAVMNADDLLRARPGAIIRVDASAGMAVLRPAFHASIVLD